MVGVGLMKHFDESFSGCDVNPATLPVIKNIVRAFRDGNRDNDFAGFGIEDIHRPASTRDKQSLVNFVEIRGNTKTSSRYWPGCHDGILFPVNHIDFLFVWNCNEKPRTRLLHDHMFETPGVELDVTNPFVCVGIENRQ